jgi:hypothetical protein
MREVSYTDGSSKTTLFWCNWCAKEHTEKTPISEFKLPAVTASPISFHGIVKLEQTRVGPHGGKIHKRLW